MISKFRNSIIRFTESKQDFPVIAAIASGLYPLLYYYYSNYTLINSWEQLLFFIVYFIGIPIVVFKLAALISKKISFLKIASKYTISILNFMWSFYLLVVITQGFKLKIIAICISVAAVLAILLNNYLKKIIVLQFLLAVVVAFSLFNYVVFSVARIEPWMDQPDNIKDVVFKKKPNIYLIQPDGYANFSELNKGYYKFDNSDFKKYLDTNNFKTYSGFRSNYYSTLSSNSSMFGMKHHYYLYPKSKLREVYNARDVIVGNNPVIDILKSNNYKTHLLIGKSYMLINRPEIQYDYCSIKTDDLSYFSRGFQTSKDIKEDLKALLTKDKSSDKSSRNFYFLEELSPSHITNKNTTENIAAIEREKYINNLKETNIWLKDVIDFIIAKDKNSLIIIEADHGGFVGMNTTLESREKQTDRDLIYSIYTAQLAIKWPDNAPSYDDKLKTPVNLFRVLFSYLSEDESYLEHLQEDKSYIQIEKGAPFGVYEYINEKGAVVFNKISKE